MTEVGISLALRNRNGLIHDDKEKRKIQNESMTPSSSADPASATPSSKEPHRHSKEHRKPKAKPRAVAAKKKVSANSSWRLFLEGAALYCLCLVLPALFRSSRWIYSADGPLYQISEALCKKAPFSFTRYCQTLSAPTPTDLDARVMAPDAGLSDIGIVVVLSLSMAFVRIALVYILVPRLGQQRRMEALVRCKSVHLLSSAYPGTLTPRSSITKDSIYRGQGDQGLPKLPTLATGQVAGSEMSLAAKHVARSSLAKKIAMPMIEADEHQIDIEDDSTVPPIARMEMNESAPIVSSGLMTSSSAKSLQALLERASGPALATPSDVQTENRRRPNESDRVYAAPKYATAVFRLLYCTVCVGVAWTYFSDADFWPAAVGGRGSTDNCWNLSSVGATVMEADFDQHNTVLRSYFLIQASYHFHSGAFHLLTAALLWLVSASRRSRQEDKTTERIFGLPTTLLTFVNLKTFCQHCFAVGFIAATYLFSSLRRLAAIGMFAFDASSWFLHLLQLSMNSPNESILRSPRWIWILHRMFVVPAFCYSRFYVFPFILGYSALVESKGWLRQLERMSVPNAAFYAKMLFGFWLFAIMGMNTIYTCRLLYHPHVKEALDFNPTQPTSRDGQSRPKSDG